MKRFEKAYVAVWATSVALSILAVWISYPYTIFWPIGLMKIVLLPLPTACMYLTAAGLLYGCSLALLYLMKMSAPNRLAPAAISIIVTAFSVWILPSIEQDKSESALAKVRHTQKPDPVLISPVRAVSLIEVMPWASILPSNLHCESFCQAILLSGYAQEVFVAVADGDPRSIGKLVHAARFTRITGECTNRVSRTPAHALPDWVAQAVEHGATLDRSEANKHSSRIRKPLSEEHFVKEYARCIKRIPAGTPTSAGFLFIISHGPLEGLPLSNSDWDLAPVWVSTDIRVFHRAGGHDEELLRLVSMRYTRLMRPLAIDPGMTGEPSWAGTTVGGGASNDPSWWDLVANGADILDRLPAK